MRKKTSAMAEWMGKTKSVKRIADLSPFSFGWPERSSIRYVVVPGCLLLILLVGALFRFIGLNWDQNQHLHPDERFLAMVATAIQWPAGLTWGQYIDTATSPLSPYNQNFNFYVYGTFPLYLVKRVTMWLGQIEYDQVTLVGRALSALFDVGSIFWLFLVGRRLYGQRVALLGSALLALAVLPIQQAHFFTVDAFANLFVVLTFYFAVRVSESGNWADYTGGGLALGAGLACKLSLFTLGGVMALAAALHFYHLHRDGVDLLRAIEQVVVRLIWAALLSVLAFRVLQPIAFEGPSILNFSLNEQWLSNMGEIRQSMSGDRDLPPGHQWTDRTPLWFPWQNMVLWGMGLPLGLAAWAGFALAAYELWRKEKLAHLLPVAYVGVVFFHQGTQWVKSLRYLLPIYPFLALLAGYLLIWVWDWAARRQPFAGQEGKLSALRPWQGYVQPRHLASLLMVVVIGGTLLYALAFTAIYRHPHTRLQASDWIYKHIPAGATLANEHWDDGLPKSMNNLSVNRYQYVTLTNYDEDTPEKLAKLVDNLRQADYVLLSSNRLYDSIPRLPLRYPMTTRYYELLFAEKLGFARVAEFTSYPRLFGLQLPDQGAEEAFTVYDHPKVTIFQKTSSFDVAQVQRLLREGIDWDGIIRAWPKQVTRAPTALMLSVADRQIYSQAGTWSKLFDRQGWANRYPVIAWLLALALVGLLAWPLTFVLFAPFRDRGYVLAKAIGLLWVTWLAWLLASQRLLPFGLAAIGVGAMALALVSALAAWATRRDLLAFVRTRWRLLLAEEALWWALFCFMLWLRWRNPDLWHPERGGEKPMDFAYLNAVVRSIYFPPYDPWFAGGYLNYYYFGFVLVATLIKVTGIVPAVAYNLAVPTFFALTAVAAFCVARNLVIPGRQAIRPLFAGLMAIVFVVLIGNLGQGRILGQTIQDLSKVEFATRIPGLVTVVKTLDGLSELATQGVDSFARPERWYWDASRQIPHPASEAGPVTEFPFFTFLFADLHAHLMALPYTLLVLALTLTLIYKKPQHQSYDWRSMAAATEGEPIGQAEDILSPHAEQSVEQAGKPVTSQNPWLRTRTKDIGQRLAACEWSEVLRLLLLALAVGALWALNTWDLPTYAAIVGLALVCREYRSWRWRQLASLWAVVWRWAIILGLGYVCFWPFHQNNASPYGGFSWWQGSRTPLSAYLTIHGLFLFILATALLIELQDGRSHLAITRQMRLFVQRWRRWRRVQQLCCQLVQPQPAYLLARRVVLTVLWISLALLLLGHGVLALIALFLLLVVLLAFRQHREPERQFTLGLIGLGLSLTLGVELLVLQGDVGRMNTVFKFYLQVWVLWALVSAISLPLIAEYLRPRLWLRRLWWAAFTLLLAVGLLYPLLAIPARIHDRFNSAVGSTLDGTAYLAQAVYRDRDQEIPLDWDRQAMAWLQANVYGSPVIVEANTPLYHWGNRLAIYTGLPTVIGWDWHQRQQRAILPADVIERRLRDVQTIYTEPDPEIVYDLLRRYNVQYIYVGALEHLYYGDEALNKFEESAGGYWNLIYENEGVKIFQVLYKNS